MEVELELEIMTRRKPILKLREGNIIEQMKQLRKSSRGSRRQIMTNQINYFDKRRNKDLLHYDKISQLNLPIGSGESQNSYPPSC